MRFPRVALLPLLLIVLGAHARAADSEPIELPENEPWRHEPSQFIFPPDVGTFTRVAAFRYDDEGRNISVGYTDRALKVLVTAYVYPNSGQQLAAHFEQVKRDVTQVHPAAKLLAEGPWKVEQGGRQLTGRRAVFAFRVQVGGQEHDVVSEAFLLRQGEHFIKLRVTCPEEKFEAASDRITRFIKSLKIPQPVAAAKSEK